MRKAHIHYVYFVTNKTKSVLYVGVTNNLKRRIFEHETGRDFGFTRKYNCTYLIYYEEFRNIDVAIKREKQIKGWRREKKDNLIASKNPQFKFLNNTLKG
jgi:putative endonuclease